MADNVIELHPTSRSDLLARLRDELPPAWRGPRIGPDIPGWTDPPGGHIHDLVLTGLPEPLLTELAWMAHWQQVIDGSPASVQPLNQFAIAYRRACDAGHELATSIQQIDWETGESLLNWYYTTRWKRFPPANTRFRLRAVFHVPRLALIAHCHQGHWWELDEWHPRCDPRIPIGPREPHGGRIIPAHITQPWLREAVKWHLGTQLEAGTLRWSTIGQARQLTRFDRWITVAFDDPCDVLSDPLAAPAQAAEFRRWAADPVNRAMRSCDRRHRAHRVHPRQVNDDLRAVAELFAFVAANTRKARAVLGASPWSAVTALHADAWRRQITPIRHQPMLNADHYVDDHALAQITAALPLLALPRGQHMLVTRGDGTTVTAEGFGDPQVMRMILLQILTGRRASEVRLCEFDCLTPVPASTDDSEGKSLTRFRYAQSKIDIAPDTILVDDEVVAIIEDQRRWVRDRFPTTTTNYLFTARKSNLTATKPYAAGSYTRLLNKFSDLLAIRDSKGRPVTLGHTHRFRHTKLTRLAELGLPIKVLQRYAGHATPSMSMHYVAQREEHAEQAFIATAKFKADGTRIRFSRDDHDAMHLFDRADRILPHGWCMLPPLQSCDKGNACLTCSLFATDATHRDVLQHQLDDTTALIDRTTTEFASRHRRPMPDDNVWLAQRRAEQQALTRLLDTLPTEPGQAIQGHGCPTAVTEPVPLLPDPTFPRRTRP
ncbi:tyrosine-type recombinase/integrase [Nocardia suismassiliense]|uniref:Tyrosine-type recombinase/integrase n=1 Tax=Nocardia suismassiliense TaxID=2077092 RepID=A0ABW6R5T9_9NOCA